MDIHELRQQCFKDFHAGRITIFAIASPEPAPDTSFFMRKLDSERLSILVWMNRNEAEGWLSENKLNSSARVVEATQKQMKDFLESHSPEYRARIKLELI
jgi:hypothetical protein